MTLNINNLPVVKVERNRIVTVAEFGKDETDGEDYTVIVRPLTVLTNNLLTKHTREVAILKSGKVTTRPRVDMDESVVIAAIHTVDNKGDLVFGTDHNAAIKFVANLPPSFRPAILRIAQAAVELGAHKTEIAAPGTTPDMAMDAEKKS